MNIPELIFILKDRPGIYFGKKKLDSIFDVGFFITGFLCAEISLNQKDDFDILFEKNFSYFVRKKLNAETPPFEFWFETIAKHSNNSDEAIDMFFKLFDEFYSIYESKTE